MKYEVNIGDRTLAVHISPRQQGGYTVRVDDGPEHVVSAERLGNAELRLSVDDIARVFGVYVAGEHVDAQMNGHALKGTVVDARKAALETASGAAKGAVRTMMPGAVVRIPVSVGQTVYTGQVLVVVEAMKMENEFKAPIDGVVQSLSVAVGQAVEANTLLVTVAPA